MSSSVEHKCAATSSSRDEDKSRSEVRTTLPPGAVLHDASWQVSDSCKARWDLPAALSCQSSCSWTYLSPAISVIVPSLKPPPNAMSTSESPVPIQQPSSSSSSASSSIGRVGGTTPRETESTKSLTDSRFGSLSRFCRSDVKLSRTSAVAKMLAKRQRRPGRERTFGCRGFLSFGQRIQLIQIYLGHRQSRPRRVPINNVVASRPA